MIISSGTEIERELTGVCLDKLRNMLNSLARLGQPGNEHLEDMEHPGPDHHLGVHSGGFGTFTKAQRIVEQHLVVTDVDEQGR